MNQKTESLYHLTDEKSLPEILQKGLIPQLGSNAQLVGDERKGVFLCDFDSIPYWQIILGKSVLLKINGTEKDPNGQYAYSHYTYSHYKEYQATDNISPDKIEIVSKNAADYRTEKAMKQLCTSFLLNISDFSVICARYYNDQSERTEEDIKYLAQSIAAVLPNLDYSSADMTAWRDFLKCFGEQGEYTFCDKYCNSGKKLWQQLIYYKSDSSEKARTQIYNFIKETFPFANELNTGGFEIYK